MKSNILETYPHFRIEDYTCDFFVADYSLQTANQREVEIHINKPMDIASFEIINPKPMKTCVVVFDKFSFQDADGKPLTQCELVGFPNVLADTKPWVLFLELKYCMFINAKKRLNDAKMQLFETLGYFKKAGVIANGQLCYLIASLPKQNNSPFENFVMTPKEVVKLKNEENIIFRGVNQITIKDDFKIIV